MKLKRREDWGGKCAICHNDVILDTEDWTLTCDCSTLDVPQWVKSDAWQRRKYQERFEFL